MVSPPPLLQPELWAQPLGPDKEITRETMETEPAASLGVRASRAALVSAPRPTRSPNCV
jgi:hypothetical protein